MKKIEGDNYMEQKQLDEVEESYFGEEFIDEEEVVVEQVKPKKKVAKKKIAKKATKEPVKEKVKEEKFSKKIPDSENKESEISATEQLEKSQVMSKTQTETKESMLKEEQLKSTTGTSFGSSPVDPWADDEGESTGFFKEASTWKTITGILVILLVVSVFTQGFNFSEESQITGGKVMSISEAESKVLSFVNDNLLQPPFVAEVGDSTDAGNLYKITLSVAGQDVDSYITKDGDLFFPQGFDTNVDFDSQLSGEDSQGNVPDTNVPNTVVETDLSEETGSEVDETAETEVVEETTSSPVVEQPLTELSGEIKEFTLSTKKWSFTPEKLTVNKGDQVKLTFTPDSSNPAFALSEFTFAIEDLNVEQEIAGETLLEFVASKEGSFEFKCGNCEDWRGMTGTLIVE